MIWLCSSDETFQLYNCELILSSILPATWPVSFLIFYTIHVYIYTLPTKGWRSTLPFIGWPYVVCPRFYCDSFSYPVVGNILPRSVSLDSGELLLCSLSS